MHQSPYITTAVSTSYTMFVTDPALVFNLTFTQIQGVPYNFTVQYTNGTTFAPGSWFTIDYTNFDASKYAIVTFNPQLQSAYYDAENIYQLNFKVQLISPDLIFDVDVYSWLLLPSNTRQLCECDHQERPCTSDSLE